MIWNFCIRRPVLTTVVFLAVGIVGLWSYQQLPLREDPDVEFPVVSVSVVLPGAEPEVVETEILEPLEEEINTVEGLKTLTSTAREQVGTITAEFELWRDIDVAAQDVRDRVNRAERDLPDDIEAPIVRKLDPDAFAILWISLTGDERWDDVRLSKYADEVLKERIESLRGVGRVQIGGERRLAVRIELDPEKLAARRVTVEDVVRTLRTNNVDIPSGRIESEKREFLVKVQGQFSDPEPINNLIITQVDGAPVRIGDVGRAVAGVENDRQRARFSGETSVGLGIVKQSDANTVALARRVRERIAELAKNFPAGLEYEIATDDSEFVAAMVRDLLFTIFLTTGLVIIVVLSFLRTAWGTLIAGLSIPASLLAGITIANILGFSLNKLSMLGLILAIGIVIDDAIVVLESATRHLEGGAEPIPAARIGTTEVAFPSIANSLSLGAVFIPVAFTAGLIGRFFMEFALTVAMTVFASTATALTLTPMLASRLLDRPKKPGRIYAASEKVYRGLERGYGWLLARAFNHRVLTVLIAIAALIAGVLLFRGLSTEFTPTVDRSQFIVRMEMPEGATLSQTNEYTRKVEEVLGQTPEVKHFFLAIGLAQAGPGQVNEAISFVRLVDRDKRDQHQSQVVQEIRGKLAQIPAGQAYVLEESAGAVQSGAPLQVVLQHSSNEALARRQEEVMAWMRREGLYTGVNSNLEMSKPQVEVTIDRDKASQMGVSVAAISNTMRYLLGEPDISEIERGAERYEVIPEITYAGRMVPEDLARLYVRNHAGELVSLGNLVEITETVGPSATHHFNRLRSATISASLPPGVALGDAMGALRGHLDETLPGEFDYTFTGQSQDFVESFRNLAITMGFAIVFVYLVLAAQFESFLHPLVILLTLPLALVGAFGALYVLDMPFGIVAFIGLIMLVGMATKNAILMVDYTNVLVERGSSRVGAARQAAGVRFRPVVMTTISTVIGILPVALGFGMGGEARAPMGVAVAAGLTATTLLTLIVIPVVYTLVNAGRDRLAERLRRRKEATS